MGGGRIAALVVALVGSLLLGGCGADEPVGESPFATRLAQVDRSLADRHFVQARNDLTSLAAETRAARDAGDLDADRADAILRAIAGLKATLPAPTSSVTATPTPTPAPTPRPVTAPSGGTSEKPAKGPAKGGGKGKGNK